MLFLWLTAATVLAHALVPVGSPLARAAGSAFSASTTDVAVKPGKKRALAEATCDTRCADGEGCTSEGADASALLAHVANPAAARGSAAVFSCRESTTAPTRHAFAFHARAPPRA